MQNAEIAGALSELATLYELDGAVRYRVLAYREAARVVRQSPISVEDLAREGRLTELPGIGKTLEQKILTLLDTGEIPSAAKLKRKFPVSLLEVTKLPGLGSKTARRLHDELGVTSLEELRAAAEGQRIRAVRGLGPKAEENILAALAKLEAEGPSERFRLSEALPLAESLAADLRAHPAADAVEVAGSVRRRTDTCKDIDLIATAEDPMTLADAFVGHPLAATSGKARRSGARILTHNGIPAELRIVAPAAFGNLLQHFTGSAEHNVQLRERAVGKRLSVSEHGITDTETGEVSTYREEGQVYHRLGLSYVEPELREGAGEIAAAEAGKLPDLVEIAEIRGDLHTHTTLSDGRNSLEEMAEAAKLRGYRYLALTDHSATHGFGNHVTAEQLASRIEEVRQYNKGRRGFRLLAGSEVNVMPDGSLDYPDELLAELDWVIASVHTSFRMSPRDMTKRIIAAIEHPQVDCIGHLTGRLLLRRRGYEVDAERIFRAAADAGTMLEINGNPRRRDLSDRHARLAAEAGVLICVNTDAHGTNTLDNITWGIATARRGWLTAPQVANTRTWPELAKLRKRGG